VTSLNQAKMAAIRSNSFVVLQIKEKGYILFEDNGAGTGVVGDWVRQANERIIIDCVLPTDIALTANFPRIRFRGTPGMKGGTLTLRSVACSKEAKVVINSVGRIRVATLTGKNTVLR
jgi:Tfp pilus assembly protein FimT